MTDRPELAPTTEPVYLVGYRCRRNPNGLTIPVRALTDPCGQDDEVWSDGHIGPRDSGRSPSSGDASDPIRLHDCGRFHRSSEPCRDGDAS